MSSGNGTNGQRTQRSARRLDRRKTQALAEQGLSTTDIAQHQGVVRTTVWRFLQQLKPQRQQLEHFKANRADCLAQIQGKALDVQGRVLDSISEELEDKGFMNALTPTAKAKILSSAVIAGGVSYDKERLERGQSTSNTSLLAMIVESDKPPCKRRKESVR